VFTGVYVYDVYTLYRGWYRYRYWLVYRRDFDEDVREVVG
jgi:hypothetical protein